ncbi:MAG TPA: DUF72 domain-containing protein [Flavobacterium sp.]|jgi:uncharacterized protein YecE (DUF72 family)
MKNQIRIGTSGWHYQHWLGTFYPEGTKSNEQFPYYQQHFDTVEINNSFYRLPSPETFQHWKEIVPDSFTYAVKASRFITHMKKLKDPVETLARFMEHVVYLGDRLGVILFQLPPGWKLNLQRLKEFLEILPNGFRYVFEFRNDTWYTPSVYELLREHNCAFCIYELAGHITPYEITADFVYIRLHGPGGKYQGSYPEEALQQWADDCKKWAEQRDVYVYFDNDQEGYAAFNALRLLDLVKN